MGTLNINEVMRYLPHRFPFLLVDRVLEYEAGKSLTALKNVTMNEPFFQGHFPNMPIMPGVLVIEALAQATGLLAFCTQEQEPADNFIYMLVSVDKARFKRQVIPGDALILEVEVTRRLRGMWKFDVLARVGDEVAASAELMCAGREIDT